MSSTVNIKEFKDCLNLIMRMNNESEIRLPVLLHGIHALGKTEIVAQISKEHNYNYVPLYLSTQDVSDLLGLPYKEHKYFKGKGKDKVQITEKKYIDISNMDDAQKLDIYKSSSTRFAMPDWLADALADERPCVFFLDEMNRGPLYVLQTMLPFVLEGRLHTHRIRKNDIVIGAMNPATRDYNVEAINDKALLSRFAHFYFEPELSEWMQYVVSSGVHPALIEVVQQTDKIFNNESVPDKDRIKAVPDRRNMYKIGHILNFIDSKDIDNNSVYNLFSAMVGEDTAIKLTTAFNSKSTLSPDNIFDGSIFDQGINYQNDLDKIRLINEALIVVLTDGEGKIWKCSKKSFADMTGAEPNYAKFTLKASEMDNLTEWINLCPKDAQMGLIKQLRESLMERYKDDEQENKGAFILMSLLMALNDKLVDQVFPED